MPGLGARMLGTALIALAGASCATQSNLQAEPMVLSATQQRGCSAAVAYSKDNHGVALLVIQRGKLVCENRGGSVSLNRLRGLDKWISASVMLRPGLAAAG